MLYECRQFSYPYDRTAALLTGRTWTSSYVLFMRYKRLSIQVRISCIRLCLPLDVLLLLFACAEEIFTLNYLSTRQQRILMQAHKLDLIIQLSESVFCHSAGKMVISCFCTGLEQWGKWTAQLY